MRVARVQFIGMYSWCILQWTLGLHVISSTVSDLPFSRQGQRICAMSIFGVSTVTGITVEICTLLVMDFRSL